MYIQLAPIQLREGVDEAKLLEASAGFQEAFVSKQKGILRRILVKAKHGGYADLVFFASKEDADRVAEAEATSEHCLAFFQAHSAAGYQAARHGRAQLRAREDLRVAPVP